MLKFESWPPEPGKVELMQPAINAINNGWDTAQALGFATGLLLAESINGSVADVIIDEISQSLRDDILLTSGHYPSGTPRGLFTARAYAAKNHWSRT